MMKMVALVFAIVIMTMASLGNGLPDDQSPEAAAKWVQQFPNAQPRFTRLHFYLNNILNKDPPASTPVAKANTTDSTPETSYGLVRVIDAQLTEQSLSDSPGAKVIGRCQGLYTFAAQEERATLMTLNFVFTAGEFNGSTLSIFGRNLVTAKYREFSVIGGSGDLRMANGLGTASTYYRDPVFGDILEMSLAFYRYTLHRSGDHSSSI
ncbi:OLC1v1013782C1 [Oldenlandia corymbosa var. corymbosa]|uniref:Dirigent protein n=1 Tax=Oldenlandia corymbosa var. corymbosa TaxID=529605 RepID=A0AAV1E1M3_OLDCO|nr:OLC1v1013782C1 [Oldenlandia corymbosa var. corymbosa]